MYIWDLQVCAAGALVAILQKQQMLSGGSSDLDHQGVGFIVSSVREVALEGFLMIDWASLQALQVLHQDSRILRATRPRCQMQKAETKRAM